MYKRLRVILFIGLGLVLAYASSYAQDKPGVTQETIKVKAGKDFVIILDSNRTTGYQWQLAQALDNKIITVVGLRYIAPKSKVVGAPGKDEWTFKAFKPSKTRITFNYVRPWEKNKPPAKVKVFDIVIK